MTENPKAAQGRKKPQSHYRPPHVLTGVDRVMKHGAEKYGRFNWRETSIQASDYWDAFDRHLEDWKSGIDVDADSGEHPLSHLIAGAIVVLDALAHGKLIDDRLPPSSLGKAKKMMQDYSIKKYGHNGKEF